MANFEARTKAEILQDLINGKDANAILAPILTSNSEAAFYYNLFVLFSEIGGDFELTFEEFCEVVDALMVSKQVHTDTWWVKIAKEFQLGDSLSVLPNGNLYYAVTDEDAQIVKRAAVRTSGSGLVTLLVAKLDTDDITPKPLGASEESAFNDYINDRNPAGIVVTVITVDGDEIELELSVQIDSQIIDVTDGTLLSDGVTKPVEDAIYSYFSGFQDDDFGGVFYANNLLAEILAADGVINATFSRLDKKAANESVYTSVLGLTGKSFGTFSGYVRLAAGFDLSANITYSV